MKKKIYIFQKIKLILYPNLTTSIFLKMNCNVESETTVMDFSYLVYFWENEFEKANDMLFE